LPYIAQEWLNLAVRWFHVFAGIMWIGQTYFFTWLDHQFSVEGQVWMVHSGGFYIVDKQKTPELRQQTLHWFKWEAALTWLSGFLLFWVVYYAGHIMVDDSVRMMSHRTAALLSMALLVAAWFLYDLMMISPLGRNLTAAGVVGYILLVGAIYGLTHLFSARAAYMQVGATLGTLMAGNVWMRILPAQRQLIAATRQGLAPDMRLAEIARLRSKQNTFLVVPVVFIMISNHFPVATYGNQYNWLILAALVLVGWAAAAIIRTR
jgi:uncharacterized membrane protein